MAASLSPHRPPLAALINFSTSLAVTYSRERRDALVGRPGPAALTFRFTVFGAASTSFKFARNSVAPFNVTYSYIVIFR